MLPDFKQHRLLILIIAFIMAFGGLINHLHHQHDGNAPHPPPQDGGHDQYGSSATGYRSVLYFCKYVHTLFLVDIGKVVKVLTSVL